MDVAIAQEVTMRFGFWPGAGSSWEDTLELCRHAEATG